MSRPLVYALTALAIFVLTALTVWVIGQAIDALATTIAAEFTRSLP